MKYSITFFLLFLSMPLWAQKVDLVKGNRYFKEGNFEKAEEAYRKALIGQSGTTAHYNLGNTLYKKEKTADAISHYETAVNQTNDPELKAKALYNKGVLHHKSNQLSEAVDVYKQALRLAPGDADIRKNLQLALAAKKQQKPEENKTPRQKQEQKKEQKKKEEPKPQQSKLTQKQAEQYLKALQQKEKELQEKMQKKTGGAAQPEKDW